MSLLRGSAGCAGSQLDQSSHGVFRPLFKHIHYWKPLLAFAVSQKVQPWSSQYPAPVCQCSQGSRRSLGHQQLGNGSTVSPCFWLCSGQQLEPATSRHWQELGGTRTQGSLNTSTSATTGKCHLRGWWPSAEANPCASLPQSPSAGSAACAGQTGTCGDQRELQRGSKHCEMGGKLHG